MTLFIGIDPGKKGAIALFDPDKHSLHVVDMPLITRPNGKGEDTNYDLLGDLLRPPPGMLLQAWVEEVWSMPKEGVSSAHAFGRNNGAIRQALACHQIPRHFVTAGKWKRFFGLSSDKGVSRSKATEFFPANAQQFARIKDDGRAEAALIALYGYQQSR